MIERMRSGLFGSRAGYMAFQGILALTLFGAFIHFSSRVGRNFALSSAATNLAHSLNVVSDSAQAFLDANAGPLSRALSEEGKNREHLVVTLEGVRDDAGEDIMLDGEKNLSGYLPVRFGKTRFDQEIRLYVFAGPGGGLHGLLATYGGKPFARDASRKERQDYLAVARKVVSLNGFGMSATEDRDDVSGHPAFIGENDTWRFPLGAAAYGSVPVGDFPEGQLARPLFTARKGSGEGVLYRTMIDGREDLNTMSTELRMAGHEILDAGTIHIRQAGAGASGNGIAMEPHKAGGDTPGTVTRVCAARANDGAGEAFIFVTDGSDGQSGIWLCLNGNARRVLDTGEEPRRGRGRTPF